MKLWHPFRATEHRANYTDTVAAAVLASATGAGAPAASATAAVVAAVGAISRPFGLAAVLSSSSAVTGTLLEDAVRELGLRGNAVYLIEVDEDSVVLRPAASFEVVGSYRRPVYRLELSEPDGRGDDTSCHSQRCGAPGQQPQPLQPLGWACPRGGWQASQRPHWPTSRGHWHGTRR